MLLGLDKRFRQWRRVSSIREYLVKWYV